VHREEAGHWIEAPGLDWEHVPARVEAVISGHLAGLPDEDRALLGAARVQGEKFAAEVTARVLGWDEEAALRRLSGLLHRQHRLVAAVSLERLASSGQRVSHYRFRHSLVQRGRIACHLSAGRGFSRTEQDDHAWLFRHPIFSPQLPHLSRLGAQLKGPGQPVERAAPA
jgi:hypothetical protein